MYCTGMRENYGKATYLVKCVTTVVKTVHLLGQSIKLLRLKNVKGER
jgi:hypothetical protein